MRAAIMVIPGKMILVADVFIDPKIPSVGVCEGDRGHREWNFIVMQHTRTIRGGNELQPAICQRIGDEALRDDVTRKLIADDLAVYGSRGGRIKNGIRPFAEIALLHLIGGHAQDGFVHASLEAIGFKVPKEES